MSKTFKNPEERAKKISIKLKGNTHGFPKGHHFKNEFEKGNKHQFKKGQLVWNRGLTKETDNRLQKTSNVLKGKKNYGWKGEDVKYVTIHDWVRRWKGTPDTCENCKKDLIKLK